MMSLPPLISCACFEPHFNQAQKIENKGRLKYTVIEQCEFHTFIK